MQHRPLRKYFIRLSASVALALGLATHLPTVGATDFGGDQTGNTLNAADGIFRFLANITGSFTIQVTNGATLDFSDLTQGIFIELGYSPSDVYGDGALVITSTGFTTSSTYIVIGTAFDDIIGGSIGNDTISSGDGNDYIRGDQGTDVLNGGAGDDTVVAQAGGDTVNGDAGNDFLDNQSADDAIMNGGDGNDTFMGQGAMKP